MDRKLRPSTREGNSSGTLFSCSQEPDIYDFIFPGFIPHTKSCLSLMFFLPDTLLQSNMQLLLTAAGPDFSVWCRILPFNLIHNKLIAGQFKSTGRCVMAKTCSNESIFK